MNSLLNKTRPPVFCPGCSHERVATALDRAFKHLNLPGKDIALVSDIGCSGLFDTFFNTHAMHGLHGRALTYAAGIKLSRPEVNVVVTMGDGGQGIGGAHLLAACRRNLNLTLLVLNNFNFGMTGGQYSATTPVEASVSSGFLNRLEVPLDICRVAAAAGAPYVRRCSSYQSGLSTEIASAIQYEGFAVVDIWGICPGRYTRRNPLTPKDIDSTLASLPGATGVVDENQRDEYGRSYRLAVEKQPPPPPAIRIENQFEPLVADRQEIIFLGDAGQRVITAGELLCLAAMTAGLSVTQKNEYNITVLRGPSISEVIVSPQPVNYTGIHQPSAVIAIGADGLARRHSLFGRLGRHTRVYHASDVALPATRADCMPIDFKAKGIKGPDRALAALAIMGHQNRIISLPMLKTALRHRFGDGVVDKTLALVDRAVAD